MGLQKGKTNNPSGRPQRGKGRLPWEAKELLNNVLFDQIENIKTALEQLRNTDPGKHLDMMYKLLSYALPWKSNLPSDDVFIEQPLFPEKLEPLENDSMDQKAILF